MAAARFVVAFACGLVSLGVLGGCQTGVPEAALKLSPESLQNRQLQTRKFDTSDEGKLLRASAALLQDLGFTLESSEVPLGLLVGRKDRDATDAGQVTGAVVVALLFGVSSSVDKNQTIRASVVTRAIDGRSTAARVTFQRVVFNTAGQVTRAELVNDEKLYQEFFSKLSKSVFLDAQEI